MSNSEPDQPSADPEAVVASDPPADYSLAAELPTAETHRRRLRDEHVAALAQWHAKTVLTYGTEATDAQFSLRTLLGLMTLACVVFAVRRFFAPDVFAGLCGLITLLYPAVTTWLASDLRESPLARQIWLLLLAIYITSIGLAMAER
ncbi:MAG: hypothetical protein JNM18_00635 [Planctomycetaceae bacterium]|nr:hypothetical protein [Planctomycetaceae bacterium]